MNNKQVPVELEYQLRTKKQYIEELQFQLQQAKEEAREIERKIRQQGGDGLVGLPLQTQELGKMIQRGIKEVNTNQAFIKGKQSIGNFFQEVQTFKNDRGFNNTGMAAAGFFGMIKDKLQGLQLEEDEFDEFDEERGLNDFYLKDKLDYDSEEEILSEEIDNNFTGIKYPERLHVQKPEYFDEFDDLSDLDDDNEKTGTSLKK